MIRIGFIIGLLVPFFLVAQNVVPVSPYDHSNDPCAAQRYYGLYVPHPRGVRQVQLGRSGETFGVDTTKTPFHIIYRGQRFTQGVLTDEWWTTFEIVSPAGIRYTLFGNLCSGCEPAEMDIEIYKPAQSRSTTTLGSSGVSISWCIAENGTATFLHDGRYVSTPVTISTARGGPYLVSYTNGAVIVTHRERTREVPIGETGRTRTLREPELSGGVWIDVETGDRHRPGSAALLVLENGDSYLLKNDPLRFVFDPQEVTLRLGDREPVMASTAEGGLLLFRNRHFRDGDRIDVVRGETYTIRRVDGRWTATLFVDDATLETSRQSPVQGPERTRTLDLNDLAYGTQLITDHVPRDVGGNDRRYAIENDYPSYWRGGLLLEIKPFHWMAPRGNLRSTFAMRLFRLHIDYFDDWTTSSGYGRMPEIGNERVEIAILSSASAIEVRRIARADSQGRISERLVVWNEETSTLLPDNREPGKQYMADLFNRNLETLAWNGLWTTWTIRLRGVETPSYEWKQHIDLPTATVCEWIAKAPGVFPSDMFDTCARVALEAAIEIYYPYAESGELKPRIPSLPRRVEERLRIVLNRLAAKRR